jgi:hypothetical protein
MNRRIERRKEKREKTNIAETRVIHKLSLSTHLNRLFFADIVHTQRLLGSKHRIRDLLMNSVQMCIVQMCIVMQS